MARKASPPYKVGVVGIKGAGGMGGSHTRAVKLHPAVIALGVVMVGELFGVVGLIVSVPIISAALILVEELWVKPHEERAAVQLAADSPALGDEELDVLVEERGPAQSSR